MFKRLSFQNQVMLLPTVAGIAFVLLAVVSIVLGIGNGIALQRIDTEFSPAEENSQRMLATLSGIHRGLQDAASALDEDILRETKTERATFLNLIQSAKRNPSQNPEEIEKLKNAFIQYFDISYDTSRRMITQVESENLGESIRTMSQRYFLLKSELEKRVKESGQLRQEYLVILAQNATKRPIYLNIPIIMAALIIILVLARSTASGAVKSLNEATHHLSAASSQLLSLAEETESNIESEVVAVNETLLTMETMLDLAKEVGFGADTVLKSADRSVDAGISIGKQIELLNMQAAKISGISQTVRSIADTSDILALNASLEGARAGKVGRGFTYVSKEIRRLSDTTRVAVQNIQQLSKHIQECSQAAVTASHEGQKLAAETTETARQITVIAARQRNATVQVTRAMDDIQQSAHQVVNGATQAKHTSIELVRTADSLNKLVTGMNEFSCNTRDPSKLHLNKNL